MRRIINGGIYNVDYKGSVDSEFFGKHPSIVIQTLKENEIYLVIPLTTYSKEKMDKVRKSGYGKRILSTNSIARIDKLRVIHKRDIKNRWMEGDTSLKIGSNEFIELNEKTVEYINLSTKKNNKEYGKYSKQYEYVYACLSEVYSKNVDENNIFNVTKNEKNIIIKCNKKELHWLSEQDIEEMVFSLYKKNYSINYDRDYLQIKVLINS